MKRLALLFALLALSALADDMVATNGRDTVRLTEKECPQDVLERFPPPLRDGARAAHASLDGKDYRACWIVMIPGAINLMYEDGDEGMLKMSDFKRVPGA